MKKRNAGLLTLLILGLTTYASAAGFAVIGQSPAALGNAYSGGAAAVDDVSSQYANPASISRFATPRITAGLQVIKPKTTFSSTKAENSNGESLGDEDGGQSANDSVEPNLYYAMPLNEKLSVGIGINAPFTLDSDFRPDWVGRYYAVTTEISSLNFNPAVSYQYNEKLSVGAGLNLQLLQFRLSNMDDGRLYASSTTSDPTTDILIDNDGDSLGYGFNLGLLYQLSDATRIGFSWRSEISHDIEGDAKVTVPDALLGTAAEADFTDQGFSSTLSVPASASLSVFHQYNEKIALMSDLSWTDWSSIDQITITYDNTMGGGQARTTNYDWESTWRVGGGANYQYNEKLLLRSGIAYEQSPVSSSAKVAPAAPGGDQTTFALGGRYKLLLKSLLYQYEVPLLLDFGLAYVFIEDTPANLADTQKGIVEGTFENNLTLFSAQVSYQF